jgi:hypothetical protein
MSYLLRGFGKDFDQTLRETLREIKGRGKDQAEKFEKDRPVLDKLLTSFSPFPPNHIFEEDFLVGAIDGSGVAPLLQYEDVVVHLVTANLALYTTNSRQGEPMKSLSVDDFPPIPTGGRLTEAFWIPMDETHKGKRFMSFIKKISDVDDVNEILYAFFSEIKGRQISSIEELHHYPKLRNIKSIEDVVIFPPASAVQRVQDHIRWIGEAALARRTLDSKLNLKYLFLDGALTLLMRERRGYPILVPNYMIRDVCARARKKGTIVAGVSKSHTVPCWGLIAELAESHFGHGCHWFCRLPGDEGPEGKKLNILKGRKQIPPTNGVTYLFRFSDDMPVLRIDFDRIWWNRNILSLDEERSRTKEIQLFQEIDFISHDARWYGYPCPLSFAHLLTTIAGEGRELIAEQAITIAKEEGFDEERLIPARGRIGI